VIYAHLCEVLRLGEPEELNRNPSWFSPTKAKRRLAEGRAAENAGELARVVDRAVARIRRFPGRVILGNDPLMRVKFEAPEFEVQERLGQTAVLPPVQPLNGEDRNPIDFNRSRSRGKILELRPAQPNQH